MKIFFLFLTVSLLHFSDLNATEVYPANSQDSLGIPKAFMMGEHEAAFEVMIQEHQALLLAVCDNNMDIAFEKWLSMLKEMEAYSELVEYDLKGIKMWLNVFWDEDGTVDHIAYYLKPNSRNVDTELLTLFLIDFMNNYKFPLIAGEKFSHYGSAAFPTLPRRVKTKEATSPKTDPLVKDSMKSGNE